MQRKANPLGLSLFSVLAAQHRQLLRWLASLDGVDPERIAFYGISYGGKSALRIPAVVEGYCLSICSSDFSDWIWRTVSSRHAGGYAAHCQRTEKPLAEIATAGALTDQFLVLRTQTSSGLARLFR